MTSPASMGRHGVGSGRPLADALRLINREAFWARTTPEPNTGCWLWTGAASSGGYGAIMVRRVVYRATRIAYALAYGWIADEMLVCHGCDTPACVNPAHLFLGSPSANSCDMVSKGRWRNEPRAKGGFRP